MGKELFASCPLFLSLSGVDGRLCDIIDVERWTGDTGSVAGVGGSDRRTGVHGLFFTGVWGGSGKTTVNDRLKGHSVFSNWSI